ncbi:MAG: hypothetical protein HFJ09_05560 [Lachnospiraceae bacterium]|nr:hypothetical protein [Lachnospiraceae bacterium]
MKKTLENIGKKLGDVAVSLGEKSCGKSRDFLIHEVAMPDILKKEMDKKQIKK